MTLRGFLALLDEHSDLVEADLSAFHHLDYRDRWRRDPDGLRKLTLRMIYVRVKYLPAKSALSLHFSGGTSAWDLKAHILADIVLLLSSQEAEYPGRPGRSADGKPSETREQFEERKARARDRARAHNAAPHMADVHAAVAQAKSNARADQGGAANG